MKTTTLNRVLIAISRVGYAVAMDGEANDELMIYITPYDGWIIWDLKKETLEEQSQETQKAISEVLSDNRIFESYSNVHFHIENYINDKKEITKIEITIEPDNKP